MRAQCWIALQHGFSWAGSIRGWTLPRHWSKPRGFTDSRGTSIASLATLLAEPADTTEVLRTKNLKLRAGLRDLAWPKLSRFQAQGCIHQLPFQSSNCGTALTASLQTPPERRLRYLAGFFDGDGCVYCESCLSGCALTVGQSYDKADVLMMFCEMLGGSIARSVLGFGLTKPSLVWRLHGDSARLAAQLLACHSICKQRQLLLAAAWPTAKSSREACKVQMRCLKTRDSAVPANGSWEYWAGFFDAEGYVNLRRGSTLVLNVHQKHVTVLECMQQFLHQTFGVESPIYKMQRSFALHILGTSLCQQSLHQMLQAGLCCKASQASLCIGMTPDNASQIRSKLSEMTGTQRFGKALDEVGLKRSAKIRSKQRQERHLVRCGRMREAALMLHDIEALKVEHHLLSARYENRQLFDYIQRIQALHRDSWAGP